MTSKKQDELLPVRILASFNYKYILIFSILLVSFGIKSYYKKKQVDLCMENFRKVRVFEFENDPKILTIVKEKGFKSLHDILVFRCNQDGGPFND